MLARTEQLMVMLGTWAHDEVLLLMMRRISLLAIAMVFFYHHSITLSPDIRVHRAGSQLISASDGVRVQRQSPLVLVMLYGLLLA